MSFIAKQPNGFYCRFSTVTDTLTDWNMTEEVYVQMCMEKAREEALDTLQNHLQPFELVKECFIPNSMTRGKFNCIINDISKTDELCITEEINNP